MQDEQHVETNKSAALDQRPGRSLPCQGSLGEYSFSACSFGVIRLSCPHSAVRACPPSEKTHALEPVSAMRGGCPRNTTWVTTHHPSVELALEIQTTASVFISWPIASDSLAGEKVVSPPYFLSPLGSGSFSQAFLLTFFLLK